jgi:hypothetical protein
MRGSPWVHKEADFPGSVPGIQVVCHALRRPAWGDDGGRQAIVSDFVASKNTILARGTTMSTGSVRTQQMPRNRYASTPPTDWIKSLARREV